MLTRAVAERAGVAPGDPVTVVHQSSLHQFRVSGILADPDTLLAESLGAPQHVYLHEEDARALAPVPDRARAVGVVAAAGVEASELKTVLSQAAQAHTGHEVEVLTGAGIGRAESPDVEEGRTRLLMISSSSGGLAIMVCLFMVATTLALALSARRRETVLLRAIGATPGQVLSVVTAQAVMLALVTRPLRCLGASGFLAARSTRYQQRRLVGVVVPLVLAVGFSLSMTFAQTTAQTTFAQGAATQVGEAVRADAVISDTGSGGIAPEVVAAAQDLPETGTVTTVQDTEVLLPCSLLADTEVMRAAARGVTEEGVTATLDLGVTSGDLDDLAGLPGRGVALDRSTAATRRQGSPTRPPLPRSHAPRRPWPRG